MDIIYDSGILGKAGVGMCYTLYTLPEMVPVHRIGDGLVQMLGVMPQRVQRQPPESAALLPRDTQPEDQLDQCLIYFPSNMQSPPLPEIASNPLPFDRLQFS